MFLMWACLVWLATTAIAMVLLALSGVPSVEVIGRAIKVSADTCVRLARQTGAVAVLALLFAPLGFAMAAGQPGVQPASMSTLSYVARSQVVLGLLLLIPTIVIAAGRQVEEMLHDIPLLVREVVAVVLPPLLVLALAQHGSPAHSSVLGVALVRDAATSVSPAMAESLAGQVPVVEAWVPALVVAILLVTRQAVRLVTWLGHCDGTPPELLGVGEPGAVGARVPTEHGQPAGP